MLGHSMRSGRRKIMRPRTAILGLGVRCALMIAYWTRLSSLMSWGHLAHGGMRWRSWARVIHVTESGLEGLL